MRLHTFLPVQAVKIPSKTISTQQRTPALPRLDLACPVACYHPAAPLLHLLVPPPLPPRAPGLQQVLAAPTDMEAALPLMELLLQR